MRKRIVTLLLALVLLVSAAALGEGITVVATAPPLEEAQKPQGVQEGTRIVVGTVTPMAGYFYSDMWGYNTSDMDVRSLLHGYGTLTLTRELDYQIDPSVVVNAYTEMTPSGGKRYTFTLRQGLTYNDGAPLTAKDYVFAILLQSAPETKGLGASIIKYAHLSGYADFAKNSASPFVGVRLLSDRQFSMEIAKEYLKYFYELSYVDVVPAPLHAIAPQCELADDGSGAYIKGGFTLAQLQSGLLDPQVGYAFAPKVTSGPYQLESYDAAAHEATFVVNPAYQGNYEGKKPHIERIRFVPVTNENMIEKLEKGEVDLLNKVGQAENIDAMLLKTREGQYRTMNYMRAGYSFLGFACEQGPTASVNVRKAVAHCLNQEEIIGAFAGSYGVEVYGSYGMGQWTTQYRDGTLDAMAELEQLKHYEYSVAAAVKLLEQDGWTLDEKGKALGDAKGKVRYKQVDGQLVPLELRWAMVEGSAAAESVRQLVEEPLAQAGIQLIVIKMPFERMLAQYYRQEKREYNLFSLATNFNYVFDPYTLYHTGEEYQGTANVSGLKDEQLMSLALKLRETPPGESQAYVRKWLDFQKRWVEVLPAVPLYSNVYFDFYRNDLMDYEINSFTTWSQAMNYAYLQEVMAP